MPSSFRNLVGIPRPPRESTLRKVDQQLTYEQGIVAPESRNFNHKEQPWQQHSQGKSPVGVCRVIRSKPCSIKAEMEGLLEIYQLNNWHRILQCCYRGQRRGVEASEGGEREQIWVTLWKK